ncbi:hypothetical protein TPHA_0I01700 [Tetrapisispora phaffii CBS 4417]|uniref:Aminoacyl-transfer RNA synthetases class-II family profile domain-containing protein n=1 Tax=Tetrapisispora phaffii (strain ATCC 24235 / CBS 4417 / NBRC 1672 / NRRL Y-8282 / UCD 70-5) TaxID=1071381 RepID=G8BXP6_TETPH|nr:hypothetical protein TPHA_0I01700 [Tetrapisispora phaffii CBS 4417]CCE64674.1 hypothetical protein TPHA_0I01700 [Tetrapisispora phaffii CBS 4417]
MICGRRLFSSCAKLYAELPSFENIAHKFEFKKGSKTIKELSSVDIDETVVINGWIDKKPKHMGKNLIFCSLRDINGDTIQLVDTKRILKNATVEDVVQAEGKVKAKINKLGADGQGSVQGPKEISIDLIRTLNKSNEKPTQLLDLKSKEKYPPEYRYLQLRLPKYHNILRKRYDILTNIRAILNEKNFMEVATPVLFKSTPEGAREFLVPTRKTSTDDVSPLFYALPQSPQQYKQLLMSSGIQNYFQVAKCFRDEDLRADRQPEFTQIDMEMAFSTKTEVIETVNNLVTQSWHKFSSKQKLLTMSDSGKLVPVNQEQSINKITYQKAMELYGIDKPDLRFPELKITNLSDFNVHGIENSDFPVFEVIVIRGAFSTNEDLRRRWSFLGDKSNYNYRTPIVVPLESDEAILNWHEKFLEIASFENPKIINKYLKLRKGDIICGSTREPNSSIFENPTPLGRLRQLLLENKEITSFLNVESNDAAIWVVDFPLFSPVEVDSPSSEKPKYPIYEKNKFTSTHHPFTMVNLEDYNKLSSKPLDCRGLHYDLVMNGVELGGGSTRVHDPVLQNYIFENILNIQNSKELFGHLLNAFEMGTPPHSGFAIGFDRMCAMLCDTTSIRDVIAFPKSASGVDLVVDSPSKVSQTNLKEYNLSYSNHQQQTSK